MVTMGAVGVRLITLVSKDKRYIDIIDRKATTAAIERCSSG
jgi:hypothetical protein